MPVENLSGGHELHGHVWKLYLRRTHRQADEKKKKKHTHCTPACSSQAHKALKSATMLFDSFGDACRASGKY